MSLNTYMDNNYNTLVEEHYYNSACDNLNDLITDFNELTEDNKNKICISVALQQRGWDIQTEKEIWEDEDERCVFRWHMKQYRVKNFIDTWNMVNEFDEKDKNIILQSVLFFNSNLMLWLNTRTFSRKINMTDKHLLEYFKDIIDYEFASQYNPTYKDANISLDK